MPAACCARRQLSSGWQRLSPATRPGASPHCGRQSACPSTRPHTRPTVKVMGRMRHAAIAGDRVLDKSPVRPSGSNGGPDGVSKATQGRLPLTDSRETGAAWGWLPFVAAAAALGILLVVVADALSRSGRSSSAALFWLGAIVIVVPFAVRLASARPGRGERISLAVLLGLTLYAVKLMRDPFGFTFPDELVHIHNANEIVRTHALYNGNSLLPITPLYPGLEALTAALSAISGLGTYGAGMIVVGAARIVMMVALYL